MSADQREIDQRMQKMFREIDAELEGQFGSKFPLHPSRAPEGATSNPSMDGLFNVGATFSAGYGSEYGRGYVVDVHIVTLAKVSDEEKMEIYSAAVDLIKEKLPIFFPERDMKVKFDKNVYKIIGDFRLDT
ncbi:MAG: hypothetical protein D6B26_07930 [Spirochaetaceae bacterium]|nr:MAG: hypothetical protein D6B26_07930 [Spirochaetaceae bacterium]